MSRIRILSEQLANQIAAGEVVERPASVVKELVENSLDAGATRIDIQVEGSGTRLLRVSDNGEGMDGDDVLLCLERHATSKLRHEDQLAAIATLGFRGEAIPSIGSVSWMTILSRPRERELGTRAETRYGVLHVVREDGCPRGTVIEVRHLFGNMPARRKFLKSDRTEIHHIEEVVKNQAIAHPGTAFVLQVDGRVLLDYPAAEIERRVRDVFRFRGGLLALDENGAGEEAIRLEGFLLLPESSPASQARLRILVNNRPVQDSMLRHAVFEGMQGFLMKGYQPAGVLLLSVPPEQVDVNVHPAKREIRFRQSDAVHRHVAGQVAAAMAAYQQRLRTRLFSPGTARTLPGDQTFTPGPPAAAFGLAVAEPPPRPRPRPLPVAPAAALPVRPPEPGPPEAQPPAAPAAPIAVDGRPAFAGLTLIGQLFSLYLLCEQEGQLVVIDQHAAHERLLYGQLRQGYLAARVPRQTLLFPVTVELRPVQAEVMAARQGEVELLGIQADHFGDLTWVVKAVPAVISHLDPATVLGEILDGLRGAGAATPGLVPRAIDDLLASMACKAAIKAGHRLQPAEMLKLLAGMEAGGVFSHCPHGRPVLKTFTDQEVERWFHRHGG